MNPTQAAKGFFHIKFVKEVFLLQFSKVFSLLAGFIGSVVFANALGSSEYGIYAAIIAFTGIVSALINFGVTPTTLTLMSEAAGRRDAEEIKRLVVYYIKISLITNLFWLLVVVFADPLVTFFYHSAELTRYLRLAAVVNLLSVPFPLLVLVWQVFRRIRSVSAWEAVKKIAYIVSGIVFVLLGSGVSGIFYSLLLVEAVLFVFATGALINLHKTEPLFPSLAAVRGGFSRVGLSDYIRFGSLIAVDKNLNNIVENLPSLLVAALGSTEQAGLFKVAHTIGTLPKTFSSNISRMLSSILPYKESTESGSMLKYYRIVAVYGTIFTLSLIVAVWLGTRVLFTTLYGAEYHGAMPVITVILITNLLMGFAVSFGPIVRTLKKMTASIALNVLAIILTVGIGVYSIPKHGVYGAAYAMFGWFTVSVILTFLINRWLSSQTTETSG